MGLTLAKCPACGAELNLEIDRDSFYCPHCGSKVVSTGERIVIEHVSRTINEADVQKIEFEREKYANDEVQREEHRKQNIERSKKGIVLGVVVAIVGFIVKQFEKNSWDMTGSMIMFLGFFIAMMAAMVFFTNYFHMPNDSNSAGNGNKSKDP